MSPTFCFDESFLRGDSIKRRDKIKSNAVKACPKSDKSKETVNVPTNATRGNSPKIEIPQIKPTPKGANPLEFVPVAKSADRKSSQSKYNASCFSSCDNILFLNDILIVFIGAV